MKTMWKFKTKHFTVQWRIEKDTLYTDGMDRDTAKECRDMVRSGKWKCFASEISVVHTASGAVLGEAFLGGSIYENPEEFRDHFGMNQKGYGSYFSQMVREAIEEARVNFAKMQRRVEDDMKSGREIMALRIKHPA